MTPTPSPLLRPCLGSLLALVTAACGALGAGRAPAVIAAGTGGGGGGIAAEPVRPSGGDGAYAAETPARPGAATIAEAEPAPAIDRPGLATTFGERVYAPIEFAPFVRASSTPWAVVALHYNDEAGVLAHARYLGEAPRPLEVDAGDGALAVALVDEAGRTLPGVAAGERTLVVGAAGERYKIVVRNATTARFEVVASVDGLDVVDGQPADPARRGYLVEPHDSLVIDGFRTSDAAVAAFRFGRVADSYAARTSGDRDVGVVGLAIFAERGGSWTVAPPAPVIATPPPAPILDPREAWLRDTADPFPGRTYAAPPR